MKLEKRFSKMFMTLSVLALAALTLAACGNAAVAAQLNDGKLTICHASGNTTTPYETLTLDFNELSAHVDHKDDLIPAPAGGCPNLVEAGTNLGKLTICHATDSLTNPSVEITIDFNGLRGHSTHPGDLIPAPQSGCPLVTPTPGMTPTPAATMTGSVDGKITICHATGSSKNPFVMITISVNGLNGHDKHPRDIIPAPAGGCPK